MNDIPTTSPVSFPAVSTEAATPAPSLPMHRFRAVYSQNGLFKYAFSE